MTDAEIAAKLTKAQRDAAKRRKIASRRFGICSQCGHELGHDFALGGVFCLTPSCHRIKETNND